MTDTNTPRDGLTDAEIDDLWMHAGARGTMGGMAIYLQAREFARAIEAKIRAADREARPAPASLEFRPGNEQTMEDWRRRALRAEEVELAHGKAEAERLAASTPPAEALECERCGMAPEAHKVTHWCDNQSFRASEARATGDHPALPGLSQADGDRYLQQRKDYEARPVTITAADIEARATGDAARCSSCDDTGDVTSIVGEWRGYCTCPAGVAASAPAAPPVAPAEPDVVPREWRSALRKLAFMARTSGGTPGPDSGLMAACVDAEALLARPYRVAATGAAGEPQPREVPVSVELVAFLAGAEPLDGVWFGEKNPNERGMFWWRTRLPEVQQADSGAAGGQGDKP